jgi:bifunctional non-homologous end joining protein LigD
MRAVSGELPTGDGWAYEIKWDGMRAIAFVGPEGLRLQSASGRDITASFPELAGLAGALGATSAVLDGEIVVTDEAGVPSFALAQARMHVSAPREIERRAALLPATYQIFDLLALDSVDARPVPYRDRRRLLADLVEPGPRWAVPDHRVGDGEALLEAARGLGLEGVVAKRLDSPYQSGRRSRSWVKTKVRNHQEMVVGGWSPGQGARASTIGSLLVGTHEPSGALRYAGRVGTGFDDEELARLRRRLTQLQSEECPFEPAPPVDQARDARWVRPEIVVEVSFGEWTPEGRLRHPVYLGERTDVDPARVVREGA